MIVVCNECGHVVQIAETEGFDRLAHFRGAFPCYKCERGTLVYHSHLEKSHIADETVADETLEAWQFHLAVTSFGTAEERWAPQSVLEALENGTVSLGNHLVSEGERPRLTIKTLVLPEAGVELHLGPSPSGAVVYKVTPWKR